MAYNNLTGFIVDSPKVIVKTVSGDYQTITANTAEVSFGGSTISITGGQSMYALAEIDKDKTIDIKITDAQYNLQSVALSSGGTLSAGADTYDIYGDAYTADATGLIVLPYAIVASSLRINGYTETVSAPTSGQFKVTIGASTTNVLFTPTESGMVFSPAYSISVASATTLSTKTNDLPKTAEVRLSFPVYSDANAQDSKIIGNMQLTIYKAKILQSFKIGGSYKNAQTYDLTLKGLDPMRSDKQMWRCVFMPVSSDVVAPTILSVVPANAATAVVVTAPIVWTFSEAINPADVTTSNFIIMKSTDGTLVAGTFVSSVNNTVVTFTPGTSLTDATKYFCTVTSDIRDLSGNRLAANSVTSFTTA